MPDDVDQWALQAVEPKPPGHGFMRREPTGPECILCGGDPDPFPVDAVPVETPDGPVDLYINEPSCLECRKDVVKQLSRRGPDQEGLDAFA